MSSEKKLLAGQKAADFTLPSAAEGTITLHTFIGKTVVLAFLRSSG